MTAKLYEALMDATISACGLEITIACGDHESKDTILDFLTSTPEQHELIGFLAIWADQYQRDYKLDGLHPIHYGLMKKYGAHMDDFRRATNADGPMTAPQDNPNTNLS